MKDKKRRSGEVSMDVAAALQAIAKDKGKKKKDVPTTNIKIFVTDFARFKNLKKYLSLNHQIFSFNMADVFSEGLVILKEKLDFPEVSDNEVLNTAGGRKPGAKPIRLLTPEEQVQIAKRSTTVALDPEVLKLYNDYKTFKVKEDTEIGTADLFKELLDAVENQYKSKKLTK